MQRAGFSSAHVPPHVTLGIAEARAHIERIKRALRASGVNIADSLNDAEDSIPPLSIPATLTATRQSLFWRILASVATLLLSLNVIALIVLIPNILNSKQTGISSATIVQSPSDPPTDLPSRTVVPSTIVVPSSTVAPVIPTSLSATKVALSPSTTPMGSFGNLFSDDFNDGNTDGWEKLIGYDVDREEVIGGRYHLSGNPLIISVVENYEWSDFSLTVKSELDNERLKFDPSKGVNSGNDYGIIFRKADKCNYYMFQVFEKRNYMELLKISGSDNCIYEANKDNPGYKVERLARGELELGNIKIHDIRITMRGNLFSCSIDGNLISQDVSVIRRDNGTVENIDVIPQGRIGFRSRDTEVFFDDINIKPE